MSLFLGDAQFFVFSLLTLFNDFALERGSYANVSDQITTSQDYRKAEHVQTWLLGSSLSKVPTVLV